MPGPDDEPGGVTTRTRARPAEPAGPAPAPAGPRARTTARPEGASASPRAPAGTSYAGPGAGPEAPRPAASAFVGPVQRVALDQAYPALAGVLTESERAALEADWNARDDVVAPQPPFPAPPPTIAGPFTSVSVALRFLLEERATFVDTDIWTVLYDALLAGGGDELAAELLRNEMVRRYFAQLQVQGITMDTTVDIAVADPTGESGGPTALVFRANGSVIGTHEGLIGPPELVEAFGDMERIVQDVDADGQKVALAAALAEERTDLTREVDRITRQVETSPRDVVLARVRGTAGRVRTDQGYVRRYLDMPGPTVVNLGSVETDFQALATRMATALETAIAWHRENDLGQSLGQMNEEAGTWYAGVAERNIEEGGAGGYIVGGLAYAGAFSIAFLDAAESLLSIGFHETATEVAQAWQAGAISYAEAEGILSGAARRAILVALVTRGVGAATSRLGLGIAARFGLAEASLASGAVRGGVSGLASGPAGLAAHHLMTTELAARQASPTARGIVERGIPTASGYAVTTLLSGGLGVLSGIHGVSVANQARIGQVEMLPDGPHRLVAVLANGTEVFEPVTPGPAVAGGPRITVTPVGPAAPTAGPAAEVVVDSPNGPMRVVATLDNGVEVLEPVNGPIRVTTPPTTPTTVVPSGWRPRLALPPGSSATPGASPASGTTAIVVRGAPSPTTTSVVARHLRRLQAGSGDTASGLVRAVEASRSGPIVTPPPPVFPLLPEFSSAPLPPGDWVVSSRAPGLGDAPGELLPYAGTHAWGYSAGGWDLFRPAAEAPTTPVLRVYAGAGGDRGIVLDVPDQVVSLSTEPLAGGSAVGRGYPMPPSAMTDPVTLDVLARSHLDPHARSRVEVTSGGQSTRDLANYVGHDRRYNEWVRRTLEGRLSGSTWQAIEVWSTPRTTTGGLRIVTEEIIYQQDATGTITRAWRLPTTHGFYDTMHDIDAIIGSATPGGRVGAYEIPPTAVPRTLRGNRP